MSDNSRLPATTPEPGSLVLVRHGETEWSRDNRHTGVTDIDLTPAGEEQARRAGAALAGRSFGVVLTSPRRRAVRTAELAGFAGAETDANLVEWDYGVYEGRSTGEIQADLGADWTVWKSGTSTYPAAGETVEHVGARVDAVIDRLAPVLAAGEDALLFAHAHVLRILAARWLGLPAADGALLTLSTAALSELGFEHGLRVMERWNAQP
ncbi:histidine phosphatase family protein [Leifsonia sp. Root112D2]|uniref:histidine phosphatase family protein n=1 Tax=Leifsonia sp. Root112D2 TaxID=1736426 RepID=UPI001F1E18F8|nr:histidine phosphatase family protein [Leifsonia sp. Root112D2]